MRPTGGEATFPFWRIGGWGTSMEPQKFPALKLGTGPELFLAKTLPCVPGFREQDACVPLPFSPPRGPLRRTHPPPSLLPFFFFSQIKSQLKFGHISPFASPAKTFSESRPLHVDLPSLPRNLCEDPTPNT